MKTTMTSSLRVVVLGAEKTGKSAVTVRFLTKRFIGEYNSNIDLLYKSCIKQEDYLTDIEILDTCSKKSNGTSPSAETQMNWADAFVIVYSICDTCSFERAKSLLDTIGKVRSNSYIPVLLLGNKTDLEHRRTVGVEEGHQVALEYNCQYYEVSAAENYVTINIAFQALLRDAKMNQQQKSMLKRRRTSLVNVSKKLGAMFSGKKDCAEFDKRRTSMDVNSPLKLT
ncbi:ras-related and estrogen-regulated growth inhibitor-like protein [Crassostrea angulata]|nr:ras-related and estrogen-regulated growth inhibitor-like protein [Crassostrea gigas]XP_052711235.1 ras-related and estrogen-regulated growth inhibitor-like protein [Crassostrea angulata]|eukprot:XP_011448503.1 PREDICTED: ras-related and estrogen-regulated growth inhibitor-like protein [Crassostrea gigas]